MRSDRAKIFAPFSPLRGLDEAYREKERVIIPKAHLLADRVEEINLKLTELKVGDEVKIKYYSDGQYKSVLGKTTAILPSKELKISQLSIQFCDIYDIEIMGNGGDLGC